MCERESEEAHPSIPAPHMFSKIVLQDEDEEIKGKQTAQKKKHKHKHKYNKMCTKYLVRR